MKRDIQDLIREARKELRLAAGLLLSPEEIAEEIRNKEIEEMEKFILSAFGLKYLFPLGATVLWTDRGVAAELNADSRTFHLRKGLDSGRYILFFIQPSGESELLNLEAEDPLFACRVMVAIGDKLSSIGNS